MHTINKERTNRNIFLFWFLAIPVLLMLVFTYYPAVKLVTYSFSDYDGLDKQLNFIGLRNWKQLFKDSDTMKTLFHSFYYIAGGLVQNALALLLAVILNNKLLKGRSFFRGIIFLPFILNGTAVSYMFRYFFDYNKGPLNKLLVALGMEPFSWLGSAAVVNWSLALVCVWKFTGYIMTLYLASLQSIPQEYYEAAEIDGCNSFQRFFYITLPQISGIIKLQMFLNISGAVNIFDIPFVITGGGPSGASDTLAMKATKFAFDHRNYGMASAYGVFCTVVIIVVYLAQNKMLGAKEEQL